MDHFRYRDGELMAEDVALTRIAEAEGTPVYCYSRATLEHHYRVFAEAIAPLPATVCYAVKANGNLAVLATLAALGAGADVVSAGELRRARAAGIPASRIVFSGVGKTDAEMVEALAAGIVQFNVESEAEFDRLAALAAARGLKAPVAVRVNPDVDARTHQKIATGAKTAKFGIEWARAREVCLAASKREGIAFQGLAVHIGSQLSDLEPFANAFRLVRELAEDLGRAGAPVRRVDLGGGLGIPYGEPGRPPPPEPAAYGRLVREVFAGFPAEFVFEPGRLLVGNAGVLLTRVLYLKTTEGRTFAIVDASMSELIRPALYEAYHAIVPVREPKAGAALAPMDVVGPVCETGDALALGRPMPPLQAGDLLAVRSAGAYGAAMASMYNARPLPPEVMVGGHDFVRVRPRIEDFRMMALEIVPQWPDRAGPSKTAAGTAR